MRTTAISTALPTVIATVIFFAVFVGICCWAWSRGRQDANRESAMLPFALPDEPTSNLHEQRGHAGRAHVVEQEH